MKLLIISDIHIPVKSSFKVFDKINFEKYDYIISCGDMEEEDTLSFLEVQKPIFLGVYGNCDSYYIKNNLREKIRIKLENHNIGIIHGHQSFMRGDYKGLIKNFDDINILFYGHSHMQQIADYKGIKTVNPGAFFKGEYAEVYTDKDKITVNLIK